jgi:hypothetical protein
MSCKLRGDLCSRTYPYLAPFCTFRFTNVSQDVLRSVPSTEAGIQASHKCNRLINDTHLFML